jgi:thiamine kinase-like enzyme
LSRIWTTNNYPVIISVAGKLGEIHRRALASSAPPLRPINGLVCELFEYWNRSRHYVSSTEQQMFEFTQPLFDALDRVDTKGVFKDANPRNWIINNTSVTPIDFGSVSTGSFASDLAQLLDYETSLPEWVWSQAITAWAGGFGLGAPINQIKVDLPIILMYSALCRAPFHTPLQRVQWYQRTARRAHDYGWYGLANALGLAIEDIGGSSQPRVLISR